MKTVMEEEDHLTTEDEALLVFGHNGLLFPGHRERWGTGHAPKS